MKKGKHRIPMIDGDEVDAFTGWKKVLCVFANRTGLARKAKRQYWKRDRRVAKEEIRDRERED